MIDRFEGDRFRLVPVTLIKQVGVSHDGRIAQLCAGQIDAGIAARRFIPPAHYLRHRDIETGEQLAIGQPITAALAGKIVPSISKALDLAFQITWQIVPVADKRRKHWPRITIFAGLLPAMIGKLIAVFDAHRTQHCPHARIGAAHGPELAELLVNPFLLLAPVAPEMLFIVCYCRLDAKQSSDRSTRRDVLAREQEFLAIGIGDARAHAARREQAGA
ncbi:hypothetical protein [Oceaniglobus ichthyenteri]|uniref:hypothetical protein n=1 Tax=Oceaniglobus ichthyenteri TaxID=2136177 RepID=UPI0013DE2C04|nr:hypothetical protein [Oceaniglobus ichthyenteri]